ncbi:MULTISPECIES: flagellar assembly protein FliW [Pelosinus]|uniref:Flagellar assembly factor FliW n=1 Tax=Pelosinus fermentans B4 TaxID=1149862 RepID=I9LKF1_9FIRM|nr:MULTISPECIES: flagellar assembly protein FliW [Pelosinus]EIW20911.1 Flagellar assembly factor FliW [Pelosinus fermentans B4]EIW27222.1 Flagellar assembly factor fliW [Pelosinus fermentans A11]
MDKKIHFPKGLIGLENYHDFMLSELPDQTQFWLLQSLEDEHFGLVITNPFWFMPNYDFELIESEIGQIGAKEQLDVFVTVNVAVIPENITANLMGPIILNQSTGIGFQTLIADKRYTTQYKLMSAKLIGG